LPPQVVRRAHHRADMVYSAVTHKYLSLALNDTIDEVYSESDFHLHIRSFALAGLLLS